MCIHVRAHLALVEACPARAFLHHRTEKCLALLHLLHLPFPSWYDIFPVILKVRVGLIYDFCLDQFLQHIFQRDQPDHTLQWLLLGRH